MNAAKLELLIRYFEEKDRVEWYIDFWRKSVGNGAYYPSNVAKFNAGIGQIIDEGLIDTQRWFMDAGGGDIRVAVSTAEVHEIPTIYVDHFDEIVEIARSRYQELKEQSVVEGRVPLLIARGDFVGIPRVVRRVNGYDLLPKDHVYSGVGVKFEDIATIFNYESRDKLIAWKIMEQSPRGTVFILFTSSCDPKWYNNLTFVRTIDLSHMEDYLPAIWRGDYLHIYRK